MKPLSLFHLSPTLCPSLQDVALHQCLPLSSVCCFPDPGGSLLPLYVVLPSSAWSSSRSLPSPWLSVCAAFGPPIVLHSCGVRPISTYETLIILTQFKMHRAEAVIGGTNEHFALFLRKEQCAGARSNRKRSKGSPPREPEVRASYPAFPVQSTASLA